MDQQPRKADYRRRINRLATVTILGWTAIIGWEHKKILDLAKTEANTRLNKDRAFRLWASSKEGLYVPMGESEQPNPYHSHLPDRNSVTWKASR